MTKSELLKALEPYGDNTIITIDDYSDDETAAAVKEISGIDIACNGHIHEYLVLR